MKNSKVSQVSTKKVIFETKKNCFNYLPNTFKHFFAQYFLVHGQEKAKLKIMPLEWSRCLISFFFILHATFKKS